MDWLKKLGKDDRGSRPRCVLVCDGTKDRVAWRLTEMVGGSDVVVSAHDRWHPQGTACVSEVQLDKAPPDGRMPLLPTLVRRKLRDWWLAEGGSRTRTPNWDIASTCRISGRDGLLLVEAKAHSGELVPNDSCGAKSVKNRNQIERAITEANAGLRDVTGHSWQLSTADHYQLSNRFAWSWKLAKLKIPVALVYLGFLDAVEMNDKGTPFRSDEDWTDALHEYCSGPGRRGRCRAPSPTDPGVRD